MISQGMHVRSPIGLRYLGRLVSISEYLRYAIPLTTPYILFLHIIRSLDA
jgi:hypothetical protein